ncbi:hypothetical protein [Haladaptatus sp. DFWS20]|uniref:hypothetical protein n=1 Tax=Haladaptatus sp. DFWS20 TaxID=3403467 RepID=UPI003EC0D2B7
MTITLEAVEGGSKVTVRQEGIPKPIPEEDAAVLAHKPPLWYSEPFAVLRGVEVIRPAGECCAVIRVTELVVLPCVNEFVANG